MEPKKKEPILENLEIFSFSDDTEDFMENADRGFLRERRMSSPALQCE